MSDQSSRFNRLLTIFFALLLAIQVVYLVVGYVSIPMYFHRVTTQTVEPVVYNGQVQYSYLLLWLPLFIALAIGILRYRLWDIDIIIRKTLQYTAVTALLSIIYFGSVFLLQRLFSNVTGQQSPLVLVVSTLLIASAMYSSSLSSRPCAAAFRTASTAASDPSLRSGQEVRRPAGGGAIRPHGPRRD